MPDVRRGGVWCSNLAGVLSGHKEGSKAFSRYREIDEQMKKDLVGMLE